ncbi:MAG: sulfite exporter TauE/SafE family protein [Burkholderiales bacterium]
MPEAETFAVLFVAGILGGIANAVAGGGTFFTFPAFLAAGVAPVAANASNSIAVWPGHALAAFGYREELSRHSSGILFSISLALAGGIAGAFLATVISNGAFAKLIPFLLLLATLLFAFGDSLSTWVSRYGELSRPNLLSRSLEFVIAIYGGFFGAGLGVILMAGLLMLGVHDMQANNALKNLLGAVANSAAVVVFAVSGIVSWPHTAVAFTGAIIGGLLGARFARWLSATWLKRIVVITGLALSIYYFSLYYL